ncbi:MAG: YDG domain-containing protein [Lachnospiraceae bacterium]|nr:YDG domain-containing protein [Lachnospiraceae bacterium]
MGKHTLRIISVVGILAAVFLWTASADTMHVSAADIPDGTADSAASTLNSVNYKIYSSLKKQILEVAEGKRTSTSFSVSVSGLGLNWTYSQLGLANGASDSAVKSAVDSAFEKVVDIDAIYYCLKRDCPYQLYWFATSSGISTSHTYSYNGSSVSTTALTIYFSVSDSCSAGNYQVDSARVAQAQAAAENAWAIVQEYANLSDEEKLKAYANRICDLVNYDYDAYHAYLADFLYPSENGDPWEVISVFDNDPDTNVVCEGYAKAFLYLCNLSSFESENTACFYASGDVSFEGNESHAWNVVSLDSGHYLVDLTSYDGNHSAEETETNIGLMRSAGMSEEEIAQEMELFQYNSLYYMRSPLSGTWETGYTFSMGYAGETTYAYDESTRMVYSEDILSLYSLVTPTVTGTTWKIYDGTTDVLRTADLAISLDGVLSAHEDLVTIAADYQYAGADAGENVDILISNISLDGEAAEYYRLSADSLTVSSKIAAKKLTEEMISTDASIYYYSGEAITPKVTVSDPVDGIELITEADYRVEYSDNAEIGTGMVTVIGQGNYTGTVELPFEITYTPVPECVVSGTEGENGWYTSEVSLQADGWMLSEDGNEWKESLSVTEEGVHELSLYFRQKETGYLTEAVQMELKLDWTPMEMEEGIAVAVLGEKGALKLNVSEAGTLVYMVSEKPQEQTAETGGSEENGTLVAAGDSTKSRTAAEILESTKSRTVTVAEEEISGVTLTLEGLSEETQYELWMLGTDQAGNTSEIPVLYEFIVPTLSGMPQLSGIYGTAAEDMTLTGGRVTYENAELSGIWSAADSEQAMAFLTEETSGYLPSVGGTESWIVTFTPDNASGQESPAWAAVSVEVVPSVSKKEVTVTVEDAWRKQGEENPTFTFTVEENGLVDGDTHQDLGVVLTTQAVESSPAGKYEITGTAVSANYQVIIVSGTLTVRLTPGAIALRTAAVLALVLAALAVVMVLRRNKAAERR